MGRSENETIVQQHFMCCCLFSYVLKTG